MKKYLFTAFTTLLFTCVFSNPDLIISGTTILNTGSVKIYDKIKIQTNIKNIGTSLCSASYMRIYLSTDNVFTPDEEIGVVSVPSLSVNATSVENFVYTVPAITAPGNYYIGYLVDLTNAITELNEANFFYNPNQVTITSLKYVGLKLPYPVIFIHGLISSHKTWAVTSRAYDSIIGYRFGGRMDFNLNYDNNKYTSNLSTDYYDFTQALNEVNITSGDYYHVNFDVDPSGNVNVNSYTYQSNQSAIYKQGVAIRDAIKHVLNVTGADKVVLVGHSMGGLCSRTYLSNSNLWQADNKHHVAKLLTVGTPHGGSNASLGVLNSIFLNLDGNSEACRDLRYPSLLYYGKFLFGGTESTSSNGGFNNDDINCNGFVGNTIPGINNLTLPQDLPYTCFYATGTLGSGDGVVDGLRADMNNYGLTNNVPLTIADTIINDDFVFVQNHTELPKMFSSVIKGMDEANSIDLAYEIKKNTLTQALINTQSDPLTNIIDHDYFYFNQTTTASVYFDFFNIQQTNFKAIILNSAQQVVNTVYANQNGSLSFFLPLTPGKYYIHVSASHTTNSWKYPYYMYVGNTPYFNPLSTSIDNIASDITSNQFQFKVFPNPAQSNIDVSISSINGETNAKLIITDMLGRELYHENLMDVKDIQQKVNLDFCSNGVYFVTFVSDQSHSTQKIIVTK